jgi:predicted TIM-barrel fold metal-dependent hydrolase
VDVVVIDAHLHLWDTERLRYEWLQQPENAGSTLGTRAGHAREPRR